MLLLRCIALMLVLLTTSGCSALGSWAASQAASAALSTDTGVEVDANVGQAKTEGDDSVAQNANTALSVGANEETTETINGNIGTLVNQYGLDWWHVLLLTLLAGWAIPSPREMLLGMVEVTKELLQAIRGK